MAGVISAPFADLERLAAPDHVIVLQFSVEDLRTYAYASALDGVRGAHRASNEPAVASQFPITPHVLI
jgi:hypothetical protein